MKNVIYSLYLIVLAIFGTPLKTAGAEADGAILLIDRTGSMLQVRPATGYSRCEDALTVAHTDVNDFFAPGVHPGGKMAVWTFADNGYIDITGGFVDKPQVTAALSTLTANGCNGLTPLAEAMCAAADALAAGVSGIRLLYVNSDGGENNSDGECYGPDSYSGLPYDAGSWQRKVSDKFVGNSIVNVRYWGAGAKSFAEYDQETGSPLSPRIGDDAFFQNLAQQTGGTYHLYSDGSTPAVPTLSEWALIVFTVLIFGLMLVAVVKHRKRANAAQAV